MKKIIISLLSAVMVMSFSSNIYSYADDHDFQTENNLTEELRTEGLISSCSLSAFNSNGKLLLSAETNSNSIMKYIGIRQISIQRSSDGVNWTTVSTPADMLTQDASESNIDTSFSVSSGYYYRIVCAHYARDYSVLPSWQIIPNISNSVWI